jgi:hypothetical protein
MTVDRLSRGCYYRVITRKEVTTMTNTLPILYNLISRYNAVAYAHWYIWGFEYKSAIYMAITDSSYMLMVCKLDKASRGGGYALRFCPTTEQKLVLMPKATLICSKAYFEETVATSKYNRGEIFEKMVTEYFGKTWEKDNVPFTKAGDIEVNGIAYQIKFQKATFCNEKSIASLE